MDLASILNDPCLKQEEQEPPTPTLTGRLEAMDIDAQPQSYHRFFAGGDFERLASESSSSSSRSAASSPAPRPRQTASASRRRRAGQRLRQVAGHLSETPNLDELQDPYKAKREEDARRTLTFWFGRVQHALTIQNRKLPMEATGLERRGWKRLKVNNVRKELELPLQYNKVDLLYSVVEREFQDDALLLKAIERLASSESAEDREWAEKLSTCVQARNTRAFDESFRLL